MSWQIWLLIVIGQGLDYLLASGVAWLAIWAFDLTYNGWAVGLLMWLVWNLWNFMKPKKKKTVDEMWQEMGRR